ncbi:MULTISPECIES: hypothetical protein [Pseudonocardia]|uniref:Polymerase nucleotidyl transferase domain-containing protein n=2 Tax=Pseudonocardia TaxID=1847 RepID=A0A1Y2MYC6_PSEAH|nr:MULTISPECIES: hypothetical protein [Pseudonocardia]OSY40192.1 hypothetical protein BG845_03015 [Pseudonocardia autotrophica]TDN72865.1 hypothetical protein C8E95_1933 [Pseudonocardia autotrophica]BBG03583.1 hypothetical protein Pdca_47920 [Pseudonocardia autotrophica]GEC28962.1 hypothetical protein PSA01_59910 [Pseudonocardia saturnea]
MTGLGGAGDGESVVDRAIGVAAEAFGPRLSAAYALGSIAHGGFAPLVSDVDVMLVLDGVDPATSARMADVRERVRRDVPGELADRLSIFWSDPPGVRRGAGEHSRLPEVDRLDLLDSGRLLLGDDCRAGATRPTTDALVLRAAEFALTTFDDAYRARLRDPDDLVAGGARPVTKAVLFPVRFLYTLATGRLGHNTDAAAWYSGHHEHADLAAAAATWRTTGLTDPEAARRLLSTGLRPIYATFTAEYVLALRELGQDSTADRLAAWGELIR